MTMNNDINFLKKQLNKAKQNERVRKHLDEDSLIWIEERLNGASTTEIAKKYGRSASVILARTNKCEWSLLEIDKWCFGLSKNALNIVDNFDIRSLDELTHSLKIGQIQIGRITVHSSIVNITKNIFLELCEFCEVDGAKAIEIKKQQRITKRKDSEKKLIESAMAFLTSKGYSVSPPST